MQLIIIIIITNIQKQLQSGLQSDTNPLEASPLLTSPTANGNGIEGTHGPRSFRGIIYEAGPSADCGVLKRPRH